MIIDKMDKLFKVLFVFFFLILFIKLSFATLSITWNEPKTDGIYYWNNFILNVSTNDNANCSYKIDYWNGTNVVSWTEMDGNNTKEHNATIDIDSLAHGYKFNISVYCENATNATDNTTDQQWFYRDYECGDTVHDSWVLGHDLDCSAYAGNALTIGSGDIEFNCSNHEIIGSGAYFGIYDNGKNNVTIENCVIHGYSGSGGGGIKLEATNNDNITNCEIYNTWYGIYLYSSSSDYIANNTLHNNNEGIRFAGTDTSITITFNNITQNTAGINIPTSIDTSNHIYKNWIYENSNVGISASSGYVDYNGMGNYWGYDGNVCPGFRPGVDSSNTAVVDRYPYTDTAFTNPACDAGDYVIYSTKLYRNITATNIVGLNLNTSGITLNCSGIWINATGKPALNVSGNSIKIENCVLISDKTGVEIHANSTKFINNNITGSGYCIDVESDGHDLNLTNNNLTSTSDTAFFSNVGLTNLFMTGNKLEGVNSLINISSGTLTSPIIYKNDFSDSVTGYKIYIASAPSKIYIDYNQEGNWWGRTSCPGFRQGTDSNSQNIIDRFSYKSLAMTTTDQCLACGATLTNSYTLQNDMNCSWYGDNSVEISTNNMVFDCNGKKIIGNDSAIAIHVYIKHNVTIKNCNISNAEVGVSFVQVDNSFVLNNEFHDVGVLTSEYYSPIYLTLSDNNLIFNNTIYNSVRNSIVLFNNNNNNTVENNRVYDGVFGNAVYLKDNPNINIIKSNFFNHTGGIKIRNSNVTLFNNTLHLYSSVSGLYIEDSNSYLNATYNTITDANNGVWFNGSADNFIFYKNKVYNNTLNFNSAKAITLSFNQMGNYWGHNSCPAFIPGNDSNRTDVVDYFAYKDPAMQLSDQCLGCGVTLTKSYTLQNDMNCSWWDGNAVLLDSNVVFDCANHKIWGNGSNTYQAILISGKSNVEAKNCEVYGYYNGISVTGSNDVFLNNITSYNNSNQGIAIISNSDNVTINNSKIYDNTHSGIIITDSTNCFVNNSYIYANNYGIELNGISNHNYIRSNILENNNYALYVYETSYTTIDNNTIRGDSSDYGIYVIASSNDVTGTVIKNNKFNDIKYGIELPGAIINAEVSDNKFYNCADAAIWLFGIFRYGNINIMKNYIYNSTINNMMIDVTSSSYNIRIENNTVINGGNGIRIKYSGSHINVTFNNVTGCNNALYLENSSSNVPQVNVWKNWFSGTTHDVYSTFSTFVDNPVLKEGNYWGYNGNVCPGFVPGVDSNKNDVVDRYPYTDTSFTHIACSCGDTVTRSTKLYHDVICTTGNGLSIYGSNIQLDCNGFAIRSTSGNVGVYVSNNIAGLSNIVVKNCNITNFQYGIDVYKGSGSGDFVNISILNNNVTNASHYGIRAFSNIGGSWIKDVNISNNLIKECNEGIIVGGLSGGRVNNTIISHNYINSTSGIELLYASYISVKNNDILSNNLGFKDSSNNDHITIINNYWGHDDCPLFMYLRDTNSQTFYDQAPWNSTHQTVACQPQFLNAHIYINLTTPISQNETNNWYYYFNGSNVTLLFDILPSNFMIYSANLTNATGVLKEMIPVNLNKTRWEANFTLNVNHSLFTSDPRYYWYINISDPNYTGNVSTFVAVINANPLDNESVAYYALLGGATTDWSTIQDFSNVNHLTFERPGVGKIVFTEPVNLLDSNFLQSLQYFSQNLNISDAYVFINTTIQGMKVLNKSANVTMYNLTQFIVTPGILRNGQPDVLAGQTNGIHVHNVQWDNVTKTLTFSVDSWSSYEADGIPPSVQIILPENKTYWVVNNSDYTLTLKTNISDDKGIDMCWYTVDGGMTNYTFNCSSTIIHLNRSVVTLIVYANDTVGHLKSSSIAFTAKNKKKNGNSCSAAEECLGGYCVHGYCRSSPTYCGDGYCDIGESSSTCALDCPSAYSGYKSITTGALKKGEEKILNVSAWNIFRIDIIPTTNLTGCTLLFRESKKTKYDFDKKAYSFIEIRISGVIEDTIKSGKIYFKVEKSWLSQNGLTRDNIGLYRYHEGEWHLLPTFFLNEDDTYLYYYGVTPGFSWFAIGEKPAPKNVSVTSENVTKTVNVTKNVTKTNVTTKKPQKENVTNVTITKKAARQPLSYTYVVAVAVILIFVAVAYLLFRKSRK